MTNLKVAADILRGIRMPAKIEVARTVGVAIRATDAQARLSSGSSKLVVFSSQSAHKPKHLLALAHNKINPCTFQSLKRRKSSFREFWFILAWNWFQIAIIFDPSAPSRLVPEQDPWEVPLPLLLPMI